MTVKIFGHSREGEEASTVEGFVHLPAREQVQILRQEIWEWATGRSFYRPSSYNSSIGPLPAQQEYAQRMITLKAIQIEVLLKIEGS